MLSQNLNRPLILILLFLFTLTYFSGLSQLEINGFLKNIIALIPLQILALIYGLYMAESKNNPK